MTTPGKTVRGKRYVHADQVKDLPEDVRIAINSAAELLSKQGLQYFNVVRVDSEAQQFAFLNYPALGSVPFPTLESSWRLEGPTRRVTYRSYSESLNPPVLHRTELLLPEGHPARDICRSLTQECERIGLFDNPTAIGFRRSWVDLIHQKGYELEGFEMRPLGNLPPDEQGLVDRIHSDGVSILRHLTALSRSNLSAPVQSLIRDGILSRECSFFDYGCGKGDDVSALSSSGFTTGAWDPYYKPDGARAPADIVNIGFVINVIEGLEERIAALQGAYDLTRKVLAVAAMLGSNQVGNWRAYRDGVRTGRNTFQKYFTQTELQQFIEGVLDEDAYPVAPGIFYVFRDRTIEQQYLLGRTADHSRIARARLGVINYVRAPRPPKPERPCPTTTPDALAYLERLWLRCLELGRLPDTDEFPDTAEGRRIFRSLNRAIHACVARNDPSVLERASSGRRNDILVMLALHRFEGRRRFTQLEHRLQKDIRAFFGSHQNAEAQAHQLLFSVRDPEVIRTACEEAAAAGLGYLEPGQALQLHTSLIGRLPAPLRVYIGCAATLAGDLKSYDLVKAHIQSGKVTLLSFDDFAGKPLPAIKSRIKVRLRDQDFDVFTYGDRYPPTLLYWKSRYLNEESEQYAEQLAFDEALQDLALFDLSAHGLPEETFMATLRQSRYEVSGCSLARSQSIPSLDEPCGANYTYRDLIECGDTWNETKVDNAPRSPDTYTAYCDLARYVLDPLIDYFGAIRLTYGFASRALTKHIHRRIEPSLDQHASCETTPKGKSICSRGGAAIDFLVEFEDMRQVADWVAANTPFDRLYYYGNARPIHVSYGPQHSRLYVDMMPSSSGALVPKVRQQIKSLD